MFRPVSRAALRAATTSSSSSAPASSAAALRRLPARRWASTAADRSRSWKGAAVRWGLAGAIVYYYNTSNVFAEQANDQYAHFPPPATTDTEELPTLDSFAKKPAPLPTISNTQTPLAPSESNSSAPVPAAAGGAGDLETEASQQGAFNEETGEINWDCPCLGGMANGPCGEDFKAAFSCFVYSKEEPKGVDCIDKFKAMQDCFRAHPDIYGAELEDDEEGELGQGEGEGEGVAITAAGAASPRDGQGGGLESAAAAVEDAAAPVIDDAKAKLGSAKEEIKDTVAAVKEKVHERASSAKDDIDETASTARRSVQQEAGEVSESEELIPKAAHDARDANQQVNEKTKESKSRA